MDIGGGSEEILFLFSVICISEGVLKLTQVTLTSILNHFMSSSRNEMIAASSGRFYAAEFLDTHPAQIWAEFGGT